MVLRQYWINLIENAWEKRPLIWLSGVRRVGKTTLVKSIPNAHYFNCDLPSTREQLADPERFFGGISSGRIVLDEVHRLADPSALLKIGADVYPQIKIIATGSSTLQATKKFKDSLTGRKYTIHLLPVLYNELKAFGVTNIKKRLLNGGLPEQLLASKKEPEFFAEWLDSFYARDINELFKVDKRHAFLALLEYIFRSSGGLAEITAISKHTALSRPTVMNYLNIMELTHTAVILRPYHGGGKQELTHQPKIYGFDTGFVTYAKGWDELREDDCGILWEHIVLEHMLSVFSSGKIFYWRDRQKREVDFVIPRGRDAVDAFECKWNHSNFNIKSLRAFRDVYPNGKNYVVSPLLPNTFQRQINGIDLTFCSIESINFEGE